MFRSKFLKSKMLGAEIHFEATETTNFLTPCNEDCLKSEAQIPKFHLPNKDLKRSVSCDDMPRKPHPFRSPMLYLRSTSINHRKQLNMDVPSKDYLSRLHRLNVTPSGDEWDMEGGIAIYGCSTTENTPFTKMADRPYYNRRHECFMTKPKKTQKSLEEMPTYYNRGKTKPSSPTSSEENDSPSLRRRASSLDFLPEGVAKTNMNGLSNRAMFSRTTSMSQRSPFRRKSAINGAHSAPQNGVKEVRPKGMKRSKSGVDALFDSIERQDVGDLRMLLNVVDVNINETNNDKFTPLDLALLSGESEIVMLLLKHGGKENPDFSNPEDRLHHLEHLIKRADKHINELTSTLVACAGDVKDSDRQLREWEWRLYRLKLMHNTFLAAARPSKPPTVMLAALSNHSVVVNFSSQVHDISNDLITKYKVEWSYNEDFTTINGEQLVTDKRQKGCTIEDLQQNTAVYVRVRSGNIKGYSPYGYPPTRVVYPSSWHDYENTMARCHGATEQLSDLLEQLLVFQKQHLKSEDTISSSSEESINHLHRENSKSPPIVSSLAPAKTSHHGNNNRKNPVMKSLHKYTNLIFNSAPKLLKKMKGRGIYLASLLYNDDLSRVLVTVDDNLPVVECDDNYSKSFAQEFYWFSKTSCTWEDLHHMLGISNTAAASQSVQIRRKLIQSALSLMSATGVHDLGPIHYKPFRDTHGSILLLAVNCVTKQLNSFRSTTMKWLPIHKLVKKSSNEQMPMAERLIPSVQEQVACHRHSRSRLPRGLYLGYLKLRTTVDSLSIVVPTNHINVLPYVKVQDVPNVTRDEWRWLKELKDLKTCTNVEEGTSAFQEKLKRAIRKLFSLLDIPIEKSLEHRLYDQEIIELNNDVIFIILSPGSEELCTSPNQLDSFSALGSFSALPVQSFEMMNMMTYQPHLIASYCRLSSIMELENYCTQQNLRECISPEDSKLLKEKQRKLSDFQTSVDSLWRSSRWLINTLQVCQNKNIDAGIPLSLLFTSEELSTESNNKASLSSDSDISLNSFKEAGLNDTREKCVNETFDETQDEEDITREDGDITREDGDLTCDSINDTSEEFCEISINICAKNYKRLTIYGTSEIGLTESTCTVVSIHDTTKAADVIQLACEQFQQAFKGSESLGPDSRSSLQLVVVSGNEERPVQNDVTISTENKGSFFLRLKSQSSEVTLGMSTSV